MDALYNHTAKDAQAFASSYYGFEEGLTQEVVCDAGDVVIVRPGCTIMSPHCYCRHYNACVVLCSNISMTYGGACLCSSQKP